MAVPKGCQNDVRRISALELKPDQTPFTLALNYCCLCVCAGVYSFISVASTHVHAALQVMLTSVSRLKSRGAAGYPRMAA